MNELEIEQVVVEASEALVFGRQWISRRDRRFGHLNVMNRTTG